MSVRAFLREVRRHAGMFVTNWRTYDSPLPSKLALAVRNRARATFSGHGCCGHAGQPGC